MDFFNPLAILVAAASSLVVGFIWYNPKVFGTAWAKSAGMTEEKMKSGNMAVIFGLALVFAIMLSLQLMQMTNHQIGALGMIGGNLESAKPSYEAFMADYGTVYRTFKHGAFHGFVAGILVVFPILGTNALFERKGAKYIFINAGFWTVCLTIMGAILCGWH